MTIENTTTTTPDSTGEESKGVTLADIQTSIVALQERSDAKVRDLAQQLGKLKERLRGGEAPKPDSSAAPGVQAMQGSPPAGDYLSRSEAQAMAKLERAKVSLSEEAQAHLDQIAEDQGFAVAMTVADGMTRFAPAPTQAPPTKGNARAGSAPTTSTVSAPKTRAELMELRRNNEAEYRKVIALANEGVIKLP